MLSRKTLGVVALATVGLAMGAGVKFSSFEAVGPGAQLNPGVDGLAKYKYNSHSTFSTLQVVIHQLQPNTKYSVLLESDVVGTSLTDAFTTNQSGKAEWSIDTLNVGDLSDCNPHVTIFIYDHHVDGDGIPDHVFQPEITDLGLIRAIATND